MNSRGESMRKLGDEELFQKLAQSNIELFNGKGVKKIITTSPHCLWTFKNEYPELGGEWDVSHYTELLQQLIADGKLAVPKSLGKKVAYYDPCYLGRHSEVYDAPRQLLASRAETAVMELDRNRELSLCCAGGGRGRLPRGSRGALAALKELTMTNGQDAARVVDARTLIDFVERSPAAVTRHDRAGWIALFAADCVIEDPVGSRPHQARDRDAIGRFYDTFIAPNEIVFHRGRDYVDAMKVLRDLEIEIRMAPRVAIRVPMFLVYELVRESGTLRIRRLAAHWELRPMVMQLLRHGLRGLPSAMALGVRIVGHAPWVGSGREQRLDAGALVLLEMSLKHQAEFPDPILYGHLTDTITSQIHILLYVLNDPDSPRFDVDRMPDGRPTIFGTQFRNLPAEVAAMNVGLAPGQVRRGLRMFQDAILGFEKFVLSLEQEIYFAEPLYYHTAVLFERYGFAYQKGRKLMERIQSGFSRGGDLRQRLDHSTPFRNVEAADRIRLRSWAIHDGLLWRKACALSSAAPT